MQNVVSVKNLSKTYSNQFQALNKINLDIKQNEIFALLGPNGAGKTTLISIICGIVTPSIGTPSNRLTRMYLAMSSWMGGRSE